MFGLGDQGIFIVVSYGVVTIALVGLVVQSLAARAHWRRQKEAMRPPERKIP